MRVVSISQTFTVLPFIEQQVSFWVGNYSANGGAVSIRVTITGRNVAIPSFCPEATAPATDLDLDMAAIHLSLHPRRKFEHDQFLGARRRRDYAGLDDVTVIAVPEPSTWALALLGFAGLGVLGIAPSASRTGLTRPGSPPPVLIGRANRASTLRSR